MTDKPNYSLKDLLNELKEKEKELKFKSLFKDCPECGYNCEKEKVHAEISALKKGISACEEALSKRNQEILEIIDHEIEEEMKAIDKKIIRKTWDIVDELRYLKRQLTRKEERGRNEIS